MRQKLNALCRLAHNVADGQFGIVRSDGEVRQGQPGSGSDCRQHDMGSRFVERRWKNANGLTLTEVLVVVAVAAMLLTLLLPAVQAARTSSRAAQCRNHLKQIGLALTNFHSARTSFPPGSELLNQTEHAWSSYILPFLEYGSLSDRIDYRQAWDAGGNATVAAEELAIYSCPDALALFPGKQDYGGVMGTSLLPLGPGAGPRDAFGCGVLILTNPEQSRPVRSSTITDGLSTTLAVGEAVDRIDDEAARWACGRNCFAQNEPWINIDQGDSLHSHHSNGAHGLFADGHVKLLTEDIQRSVLGALCTRNAGDDTAGAAN